MKISNLKLVLRTLYRNKLYTLLNVLGLSIGMTSAMLIFLWVQFQISFDRFHSNNDQLYRVIQDQFYTNGEVFHVQVTPPGMSQLLKENVASITHSCASCGRASASARPRSARRCDRRSISVRLFERESWG